MNKSTTELLQEALRWRDSSDHAIIDEDLRLALINTNIAIAKLVEAVKASTESPS